MQDRSALREQVGAFITLATSYLCTLKLKLKLDPPVLWCLCATCLLTILTMWLEWWLGATLRVMVVYNVMPRVTFYALLSLVAV